MALTANTIPSQVTTFPCPYDATLAFTSAQTLTATGYLNNLNSGQLDLGGGAPVSAAGRTDFIWNMDITAIDVSSGDETYKLHLFGSQDVAFGNGNVELLAFHDLAAASAGRQVATILGVTPDDPADQPRRHHHPVARNQPDAADLLPVSARLPGGRRHHAVDHADVVDQPGRHRRLRRANPITILKDCPWP
jgi:hypothetical protein